MGRATELDRVRAELAQARLVTLTGVGGVGKTRLALEVAATAVPEYLEGAWLVELAGVRDPDLVADAVVAAFGLKAQAGSSSGQTLLEFLRAKTLLLVLDNCEHLLGPVGNLVAQVMRGCPAVRVLVTSREALNVAGERLLGVASLPVPAEGAQLDAIGECESVVLFEERARAVKASFGLDASNADAVAQVCRRLDGIPLAIELAAARVTALTPTELAGRLDQRFRLLTGGQHSAVERHQTLRAAIDWSYDLLSEAEQDLLARASVFAGGFSLEAAEAVTAAGAVETEAVFELLASLVARSLVVADTEEVDTRYGLLETIRQYARERLQERGDLNGLRLQHASYYADFGERALAATAGPDGVEWERRLDRESDNFRAALAWAIDTQEVDKAVRLLGMWAAPTSRLTDVGGHASALRWADDAVLSLHGAADHQKYPVVLVVAAAHAWARGDTKLALQRCGDAAAAGRRLNVDPVVSLSAVQSSIALGTGRATDAVEYSRQAVETARAQGGAAWLIQALAYSALARTMIGDLGGAEADAEEILSLRQGSPNTRALQAALGFAALALSSTKPQRALVLAREVVAVLGPEETSSTWPIAGEIAAQNDEPFEALAYFDKGIQTLFWVGHRTGLGTVLRRVGTILPAYDPEAAAVLLGAGGAMAPEYSHSQQALVASQQATTALEALLGRSRYSELHAQRAAMSESDATQHARAAISHTLKAQVLEAHNTP